jgi:uncharacterized oxidoreductase
MKLPPDRLAELTARIFLEAGCQAPEAERIAYHLVEANLVGHDSHGVIRVASYVQWLRAGKVLANRSIQVVFENDAIAVVDGQFGFGQTIGEQAMRLGIEKCGRHGVAVIALRNSGHLGRIGDWPLMAARAGKLSLHFVNTSGAGILVAPHGGISRRLSANPIAAGIPIAGGPPIILDMSACTIAEGKIRVALNKGAAVPENCIIDSRGQPTTDPRVFYADPPGAILSIAGHKGYGLAVLCEVLAGALTGGGCSNPHNAGRVVNGMLSIVLDPSYFQSDATFAGEIRRFIDWVKSSQQATPGGEILMPGEPEQRTKAVRLLEGIDIDDTTWCQILEAAHSVGLMPGRVQDILVPSPPSPSGKGVTGAPAISGKPSATPVHSVKVGQGPWLFDANADWARLPPGFSWTEATAVAVDGQDRIYVFNRGDHPVMVFDPDGTFLYSWGEGQFARPHGISIDRDGALWCADDHDHTVRKFTPQGRLLLTLGTRGRPSDTGATSVDFRTIRRSGPPFHYPTNTAFSPQGEIYVSDGYGNARIHKFAPDGRLLLSWGEPGGGPGQFHIPHGIAVGPGGTVYVADRENSRIQLFTPDGAYLAEWTNVARPCQVALDGAGFIYVAELGFRAGMWPGTVAPTADAPGGRLSIFSPHGELVARWGGGIIPTAAGDFFAPHDVCVDSRGDIYVAEVVMSAGGKRGLVSPDCHSLQKFVRQPAC